MNQNISQTFIGTDSGLSLHYGLSYYGPKMLSADKTTVASSFTLLDKSKKILLQKTSLKITGSLTAGIALPSWVASMRVEDGEITDEEMKVVINDNTLMGGTFAGLLLDLNLSFITETWIPKYYKPTGWFRGHWVTGHWDTDFSKNINIPIDVIPECVDLVYGLAKDVPGLKKLVAIMPSGLLDNMQDSKSGIVNSNGVLLKINIPMKWDFLFISRQLAEIGADVLGNLGTPALAAAITAVTTVGEAMISLEEETGVVIKTGPEIDFLFPLRVKITKLLADDVVFEDLEFSGNKIVGKNPNGVVDANKTGVISRIGIECKQTLEAPEMSFGVWSSITVAKIFSDSGDLTFNLIALMEKKLDVELGIASFSSRLSNEIGNIDESETSPSRSDTIKVNFI